MFAWPRMDRLLAIPISVPVRISLYGSIELELICTAPTLACPDTNVTFLNHCSWPWHISVRIWWPANSERLASTDPSVSIKLGHAFNQQCLYWKSVSDICYNQLSNAPGVLLLIVGFVLVLVVEETVMALDLFKLDRCMIFFSLSLLSCSSQLPWFIWGGGLCGNVLIWWISLWLWEMSFKYFSIILIFHHVADSQWWLCNIASSQVH